MLYHTGTNCNIHALHHIDFALHCIALRCITSHDMTLHCIASTLLLFDINLSYVLKSLILLKVLHAEVTSACKSRNYEFPVQETFAETFEPRLYAAIPHREVQIAVFQDPPILA